MNQLKKIMKKVQFHKRESIKYDNIIIPYENHKNNKEKYNIEYNTHS